MKFFSPALVLAVLALSLQPALAHHPIAQGPVHGSVAIGLLSGFAHPMVDLEHLFFLIGLGILTPQRLRSTALLITASALTGLMLGQLFSLDWPVVQAVNYAGAAILAHFTARSAVGIASLPFVMLLALLQGIGLSQASLLWGPSSTISYGLAISLTIAAILFSTRALLVKPWLALGTRQRRAMASLVAGICLVLSLLSLVGNSLQMV
ncbi:MAG: hypothetical protein ACKOPT_13670 [Cyanobium sp.]